MGEPFNRAGEVDATELENPRLHKALSDDNG